MLRRRNTETGSPISEALGSGGTLLSASFNRGGTKVVTTSIGGGVRVWDIGSPQGTVPEWVPKFVEALSGQVFSKAGVLEVSQADRAKIMYELRNQLKASPDNDDWAVLGRWFLGDLTSRMISPFSKVTVPQCIEAYIREGSTSSLDGAEQLAHGDDKYLQLILMARNAQQQRTNALDLANQGRLAEAEVPFHA